MTAPESSPRAGLELCPCCNGEARLEPYRASKSWWVECYTEEGCGLNIVRTTARSAIAAWNQRASLPADGALRDILHKRFPYVDQQDVNRPVTVHWFDVVRAVDAALTPPTPAGPPYVFRRYVNGREMAEDVMIERETTLEAAMLKAAQICPKAACTVLVLDQQIAPPTPAGDVEIVARAKPKVETRHESVARDIYVQIATNRSVAEADKEEAIAFEIARFEQSLAALAKQGSRSEWQDISTAPKDGTMVDLWCLPFPCSEQEVRWTDCYYEDGNWLCSLNYLDVIYKPTHWMPKPEGPTAIRATTQKDGL